MLVHTADRVSAVSGAGPVGGHCYREDSLTPLHAGAVPGGIRPTTSYLLVRDLPHHGCHHTEGPGGIFLPHFCAVGF